MKKLIIALSLLIFCLASYSQTNVRMAKEQNGYFTVTNDTMLIVPSDRIIKGSIKLSDDADSCTITGRTFAVGGIATNGVTITPGTGLNFGFDYAILDTMRIACYGKVWITLLHDPE